MRLASEVWRLQQPLDFKLNSSVAMIHKHDSLAGGVARQAGRQADHTAGKLHFCVWLLLLVQKGVAQHLHSVIISSQTLFSVQKLMGFSDC